LNNDIKKINNLSNKRENLERIKKNVKIEKEKTFKDSNNINGNPTDSILVSNHK
jgi:hypothetical protein